MRVSKDHESTCARTELVYVHPPAEEKSLETATTKVFVGVGVEVWGGVGMGVRVRERERERMKCFYA